MLSVLGAGMLAGCAGGDATDDAAGSTTVPQSGTQDSTAARPTGRSTPESTEEASPTAEPTTETTSYTSPTLAIAEPPAEFQPAFDKSTDVFGVLLVATERVSASKLQHAAAVMALDNDEDGVPDDPAVVDELVEREATLVVPYDESELEAAFEFLSENLPPSLAESIQDLHAAEVHPDGLPHSASASRFDATLEEVLHLVTHVGYASVYPDVFGERPGSAIAEAMDAARGGHFEEVPGSYPGEAWYTYDDTCDYGCQVTEYTYWAATSIMGAQQHGSRPSGIDEEWQLATPEAVAEQDPAVVEILSDPAYNFPLDLPDGTYDPAAG